MQQYSQVIDRLKSGKLTEEDKKHIEKLLSSADSDQKGETIGGRRVVAKLPHGMDVVK